MKKISFKQLRVYAVCACVLSLLLVAAISIYAQAPTAVILGTVKDTTGGTVAGATVTVSSADTGLSRSQPTLDDGSYRFNALPVGHWSVSIMKEGFQTYQRTGLDLVVGQEAVIDATLQVGATGQTVTVTGEAPVVNTTNATLGGVVDEVKVEDLPLNGRNFVDLTLLQPGVTQTSITTGPYGVVGTMYTSNGGSLRSNGTTIDGASMTNLMGYSSTSAISTTLGIDGIKEYKVITNMFSAEYGLTTGSQTVIVSKSGTNQWHGDAFEYLRNDKLDAKNFFDTVDYSNARGLACDKNGDKLLTFPCDRIPPYKRNNFGGSFGGAIKKDKAFFYGVYEGLRERFSPTTTATVFPIGCYVDGSDVLHSTIQSTIDNNPATNPYDTNIGGTVTACTKPSSSPNNKTTITVGGGPGLAQNQILQFTTLFPQPLPGLGGVPPGYVPGTGITQPPTGFNYQFPFVQPSREDYEQLRLDENFNAKDSAFARYTVDWSSQYYNGDLPQFRNHNRSLSAIGTVSETHILSPTVLNQAHLSFSRTDITQEIPSFQDTASYTGGPAVAGILIPGRDASTGITTGSGTASLTGFGAGPSHNTTGNFSQNIWQVSDDVFWNKGKHAFKFGTLIDHYTGLFRVTFQYRGTLSFPNLDSFFQDVWSSATAPTIGGGGAPIPAYIQNGTNGVGGNFSPQSREYWWNTMGFYIQNDYRMLPRVTLNLGLRYEFMTLPQAPPGLSYTVIDPSIVKPCTIPTGQFGCSGPANGQGTPALLIGVNHSLHNFSPRVGFAWDVFGNGKTSLRGGAGIYYDIANLSTAIAGNATGDPSLSALENIAISYPSGYSGAAPIPLSFAGLHTANCTGAFQFTPTCPANSFQNLGAFPCANGAITATYGFVCPAGMKVTVSLTSRVSDYRAPQPTLGEWNLTLDRQLPQAIDLTVSYVGTKGWHVQNTTEGNPTLPTGICSAGTGFNCGAVGLPYFCDQSVAAGGNPALGKCGTNNVNDRPNTNLGAVQWYTDGADSYYQGLQASLNKRLSNGLQFQVSYTYAKVLDDGEKANGDGISAPLSGQTLSPYFYDDKGRAFFDVRHNLRFNAIYHIPDLKSDHFYAGFLHGWWVGDITSFQTGFPINIVDGTDRSQSGNTGASGSRPNLDPSYNPGTVVTGNPNHWFNTTMFDLNPAGTYGNAPRDSIDGPKLSNTDFSVSKDTRLKWLGEAGNLEIRVEMFNVFNHPSFLAPGGSIGWSSKNPATDASGQFQDARFEPAATAKANIAAGLPAANATAGAITGTSVKPRNIQLSAKIIF